ncbi:MAG: sulfotransferase [Bryobacterales bacterium]|jgi:hypothetical protein|nr:sulfotransferase [Bryobacterales bacterium]
MPATFSVQNRTPSGRRGFVPRPDDIYIATYPRSGTSLVQMLLYQLTTDGEVGFDHISSVMPFLERSLRSGESLESLGSPRIFKTHLPYRLVSRWPGKYIYVAREGKDVLLSYFHMYRDYVNPGTAFPTFFEDFLAGRVQYGSWFQHVAGWEPHRGDSNVLYLHYEDLVSELDRQAEKIAEFCGFPFPPDQRARILERCSFASMRQHERKFAPENPRSEGSFIRRGQVGGWKDHFTNEQVAAFEQTARLYFG